MMEIIHEGYYHRPCSAQVITKEKCNEQVHTVEVRMDVIILISQAHSTLLTITAPQRTRRTPQQVDFEENHKNLCWSERINNRFICVGVDFSIYALLTGERSSYSPV